MHMGSFSGQATLAVQMRELGYELEKEQLHRAFDMAKLPACIMIYCPLNLSCIVVTIPCGRHVKAFLPLHPIEAPRILRP